MVRIHFYGGIVSAFRRAILLAVPPVFQLLKGQRFLLLFLAEAPVPALGRLLKVAVLEQLSNNAAGTGEVAAV